MDDNIKFDRTQYRAAMTTGINQCVTKTHWGSFRQPPLYENVMAGCFENGAEMWESCGLSCSSPRASSATHWKWVDGVCSPMGCSYTLCLILWVMIAWKPQRDGMFKLSSPASWGFKVRTTAELRSTVQTVQGFTLFLHLIRKVGLSITTPDALTAYPPLLVGSEFSFSPSLSE